MLQITEEGRRTVASLEFAEEITQIILILHQDGQSKEDIANMVRVRIAVVLTEQDGLIGPDTSDVEAHEFAAFMIEHFDEIESVFDKCTEMLKHHDLAEHRN